MKQLNAIACTLAVLCVRFLAVIYFIVSNDRPLETRTLSLSALTPPWGQSGTTETCRIENSLYMGGKQTHTHVVQIQQKVE